MSKSESPACQWGSQKQPSIILGWSAEQPAQSVGFEMTNGTKQVFSYD